MIATPTRPLQKQDTDRAKSFLAAFRDTRIALTTLCGTSLALSFIPGLFGLAYISALCGSYEAVRSAYSALRDRHLDVNLLMVIAAAGAVAVGRVADAAGLLFLFSLSTTLESIAMARTRSAIEGLIRLRPSQAWLVREGQANQVPVEELKIGDLIRVPAYDAVPTDAEVVEGSSSVDQSAMTGESVAVLRMVGDQIVGGTQNLEGTLLARVTAVVGDSALDRIVALVQDAQENKASGERISEWFGERYTIFVLLVFGISLGVRGLLREPFSEAFYLSLTLLVGMSPCALVISTPATTLSALAWCARNGILVRGGEYIERVGLIKSVALDKTGTLTWGRPVLRAIVFVGAGAESPVEWKADEPMPDMLLEALGQAAAVEQFSNHPIATAIVNAAKAHGLEVPDSTEHKVVSGLGVVATTALGQVLVGREQLLRDAGVTIPECLLERISSLEADGNTVSLVATAGGVSAFALSDGMRDGAAEFVSSLRQLGVQRVAILTGDRLETARAIGRQAGIEEVSAGLLPGQKTELIQAMSESGPVMMVGDGVNDAPSLASASVGVAMGGLGSDVAMNAADVVLVHDHIERIPELIRLGRQTVTTIRINLGFAGAMVVGLTVASLVTRLPLPLAVVGHEGSTVIVILNGLRMLRGPR